jgi:hypothetical protein
MALRILLWLAFFLSSAAADLYYIVVHGNSVPTAVQGVISEDAPLLIETLHGSASDGFTVIRPGQGSCPALYLGSCGSGYCKGLGCVSTTSNAAAVTDVSMAIEENLDRELVESSPPYCPAGNSCDLWTRVYHVNPDGSLTGVLPARKLGDASGARTPISLRGNRQRR